MRITILYNQPDPAANADDLDVLVQRDAVNAALTSRGHDVTPLGCTLDLQHLARQLDHQRPELVFNLVEALGGSDRLMPLPAMLLEARGIPYTGSPAAAMHAAIGKITSKHQFRAAGVPTPEWLTLDDEVTTTNAAATPHTITPGEYIIKSIWEHASVGIDDSAVVAIRTTAELRDAVARRSHQLGTECFAERYIPGREFNLSLLADGDDVEVLPPAEIDFSAFRADQRRIVGYAAKWDADSFEYQQTPRRFPNDDADQPLLKRLSDIARTCWRHFGLGGYARVDFRVDESGQPFVLEVNVNPCLSPDAGVAAAIAERGMTFESGVARIVAAATTAAPDATIGA